MGTYIITAITYILIITNWILGERLYKEPNNRAFFNNVTTMNLAKERYITANPKYILRLSICTGIFMGFYLGLANLEGIESFVTVPTLVTLFGVYLMELTRTISLKEGKLKFSRFLYIPKEFDVMRITGMYIYSYNKKFLKNHAYTTKLVIVEDNGKKHKFSLSSLDNKAVLNLMKDTFGVTNNKMYIAKTRDIPAKQPYKDANG